MTLPIVPPPPRLSDEPFPPYRFVPGQGPHPFAHVGGWGYGQARSVPPYLPPERWQESRAYLYGCDLFNAGWWWEAHECWEEFWHVCKDHGSAIWDDLLRGLIQLAACALNRERGVHSGAGRLLETGCAALLRAADPQGRRAGLDLQDLCRRARTHLGAEGPPLPGLYLLPAAG